MGLTYLNPDAIKGTSIDGTKLKENSISISNIDSTVASKSYVDEAIASAITTTLNTAV